MVLGVKTCKNLGISMVFDLVCSSWAAGWEAKSKQRAKPSHVAGWKAGDHGSILEEPDYMSLAGPWIDGKPPKGKGG